MIKYCLTLIFLLLVTSGYGQLKVVQNIRYYKDVTFDLSPIIPLASGNNRAVNMGQMRDSIAANAGGANSSATYLVKTATNAPANATVLGTLATGLLKSTTSTGNVTIAVPKVDYLSPSDTVPLSNYISGTSNQLAKFRGDSSVIAMAAGTNGQVMTMVGSSPGWADNAGGANSAATYLVKTATNAPANATVLGTLATGLLKSTTSTGNVTIAVPKVDYLSPSDTVPLSNYISGTSNQLAKFRGDSSVIAMAAGTNGQVMTMVGISPGWADNAGGANSAATYLVKTAINAPANATVLGTLATGLLKSTASTGNVTIAVPKVDYLSPSDTVPLSDYISGTAGRLAVFRGDSSVIAMGSGTEGQVVTSVGGTPTWQTPAGGTGGMNLLYADLSQDVVINSTTLTDVTGMVLMLAANSKYIVEFMLVGITSTSVNDVGFGINLSNTTGATIIGGLTGPTTLADTYLSGTSDMINAFNTATTGFFRNSTLNGSVTFKGRILTGATAPTVQVRVQGSSGQFTIYAGSFITAIKILL